MHKKKKLVMLFMTALILSAFTTILVNASTVPGDYATIQEAINAAGVGEVITVNAGTYIEDLVIDVTDLELVTTEGAVIKGIATGTAPGMPANIKIDADGVEIHGFTIESPDVLDTFTSGGLIVWTPNVEIYDNDFVSFSSGSGDNVAIQTLHDMYGGDVSGLHIHDNTFSGTPNTGYVGIYVNPDGSSTEITIEDNTLTGYLCQGIITERSYTNILDNTIITDQPNTIYGNGIGAYVAGAYVSDLSDIIISGNLIKGSGSGLGFRRGIFTGWTETTQTDIVISENTVQGCDYGVLIRVSPEEAAVNYNALEGNNVDVENTVSGTVDATMNWWEGSVDTVGDVDVNPTLDLLVNYLPAGVDGVTGPQGPTGSKGNTGSSGSKGSSGSPGVPGIDGVDGTDGADGSDGHNGVDGTDGSDGATGSPGEDGPQGIPGIDGAKGDTGETGPQGPAGPAAVAGVIGGSGLIVALLVFLRKP